MIEAFTLLDPNHTEQNTKLLESFDHPIFKGEKVSFFKQRNHVIIYAGSVFVPIWIDGFFKGSRR